MVSEVSIFVYSNPPLNKTTNKDQPGRFVKLILFTR
jgi:hypothetical protein